MKTLAIVLVVYVCVGGAVKPLVVQMKANNASYEKAFLAMNE